MSNAMQSFIVLVISNLHNVSVFRTSQDPGQSKHTISRLSPRAHAYSPRGEQIRATTGDGAFQFAVSARAR
eukprot:6187466-Pleurochrysis_carterae.AAC.1